MRGVLFKTYATHDRLLDPLPPCTHICTLRVPPFCVCDFIISSTWSPNLVLTLLVCHSFLILFPIWHLFIFIHFQFIYRWQILIHLTIRLASHKHQSLSHSSGAINSIAECCYRWHQIFETEPQFVVLIKVNTNQNRNAKIRQYAPNWQMALYQNDLIKIHKIIVNASAGYI